jgi:hypothetical protein
MNMQEYLKTEKKIVGLFETGVTGSTKVLSMERILDLSDFGHDDIGHDECVHVIKEMIERKKLMMLGQSEFPFYALYDKSIACKKRRKNLIDTEKRKNEKQKNDLISLKQNLEQRFAELKKTWQRTFLDYFSPALSEDGEFLTVVQLFEFFKHSTSSKKTELQLIHFRQALTTSGFDVVKKFIPAWGRPISGSWVHRKKELNFDIEKAGGQDTTEEKPLIKPSDLAKEMLAKKRLWLKGKGTRTDLKATAFEERLPVRKRLSLYFKCSQGHVDFNLMILRERPDLFRWIDKGTMSITGAVNVIKFLGVDDLKKLSVTAMMNRVINDESRDRCHSQEEAFIKSVLALPAVNPFKEQSKPEKPENSDIDIADKLRSLKQEKAGLIASEKILSGEIVKCEEYMVLLKKKNSLMQDLF